MVLHKLPASQIPETQEVVNDIERDTASISPGPESSDDDDDQAFSDWISDEHSTPARSLFDEATFPKVQTALEHDKEKYGFDLEAVCKGLGLDFHGRVKLINYIRKEKPTPQSLGTLTGKEPFMSDDAYLKPVIEDDPLLQFGSDDWSDEEDELADATSKLNIDTASPDVLARQVRVLQKKLRKAQQDLSDYKALVATRFSASIGTGSDEEQLADLVEEARREPFIPTNAPAPNRDDDTHYFDSYATVDIHYTMLKDMIRTSTYAAFILSTPQLFKDAIVLDVGCGTGILSLFAARAGAKRVFAVDASVVADKAKKIVEGAGLSDVITVITGKVENITLPDGITHVDVIVSEWMGYALLYESMLDSVLVARDRFLRPPNPDVIVPPPREYGEVPPLEETDDQRAEREEREEREEEERRRLERERIGGVMAPSQCRIVLGMCEASEVWKERVEFWEDVYGYDMSVMAESAFDEAIIDIIQPESVLTSTDIINDIHTSTQPVHPSPSNFKSRFTLTSISPRRRIARAFVLYFDTFFTVDGKKVPKEVKAKEAREGEGVVREVWRVGKSGGSGSRVASPERSPEIASSPTEEREMTGILRRKDSTSSNPTHSKQRRRSVSRKRTNTTASRKSVDLTEKEKERQRDLELETEYGLEGMHSFSTGPRSEPTHWKQTLFLLREGIMVEEGSTISGTFHCRQSVDNSRELDVEIHYKVDHPPGSKSERESEAKGIKGMVVVQSFKVR